MRRKSRPSGPRKVFVVGAGGHAKVVVSLLAAAGVAMAGVFDDDERRHGTAFCGLPVLGPIAAMPDDDRTEAVAAIGDNRARRTVVQRFSSVRWLSAVHPFSWVHDSVRLGEGALVFAGAVVQPDAVIGAHSIVNTSASVDHDSVLGRFVHVAPGARLAGAVTVGEGALVGIGSAVIPGKAVGAWSIVGAGAAVTAGVPPSSRFAGVPARRLV